MGQNTVFTTTSRRGTSGMGLSEPHHMGPAAVSAVPAAAQGGAVAVASAPAVALMFTAAEEED